MNDKELVIIQAKKLGVIRPRDLGVPRTVLGELVRQGRLERTGWGLYRLPCLVSIAAKMHTLERFENA